MTRNTTDSHQAPRRRLARPALIALAAVTVLGLAACSSSERAGDVAQGPAGGDAIAISMGDMEFGPASLELKAGEKVTVEVTNNHSVVHDFAIASLDLNTGSLEEGEVATATFTVPDAATEFVCTFHPDMKGRIQVK